MYLIGDRVIYRCIRLTSLYECLQVGENLALLVLDDRVVHNGTMWLYNCAVDHLNYARMDLRLELEHVEGSAKDFARLQGLNEGFFMNDRSSGGIDEDYAILHFCKCYKSSQSKTQWK